jgi:hypothetical protein
MILSQGIYHNMSVIYTVPILKFYLILHCLQLDKN